MDISCVWSHRVQVPPISSWSEDRNSEEQAVNQYETSSEVEKGSYLYLLYCL